MLSAEKPPITEGSSLLDFPTMVSMVLALSERLATFRSVGRSDLDRRSCRHLVVHIEPRASGGLSGGQQGLGTAKSQRRRRS